MKYVPTRMCIVCRKKGSKDNFIKILKNQNTLSIGGTNKDIGRGYYVCNNKDCINKLINKKLLNKKLKTQIEDSFYKKLGESCVE